MDSFGFYNSTDEIEVGQLVGVLYGRCFNLESQYQITKVVRKSAAGNVWIEGSDKPFGKRGFRNYDGAVSKRDWLMTVEKAEERIVEAQQERLGQALFRGFQDVMGNSSLFRYRTWSDSEHRLRVADLLHKCADAIAAGQVEVLAALKEDV